MKYFLAFFVALISSIPVYADDCLDAGVRFRSFGDTGGGEVYLGVPDLGVGSNRVETNFNWNSPGTFPFTFNYDRNGDIDVEVNGRSLSYSGITFTDIDTLLVTVASRDQNSSARLEDLEVNGQPITVTNPTNGVIAEAFRIADVSTGQITGTIILDGPFSNSQELSRVEIKVGNDDCDLIPPPSVPEAVPVPTMGFWGMLILILLVAGIAMWKIRW